MCKVFSAWVLFSQGAVSLLRDPTTDSHDSQAVNLKIRQGELADRILARCECVPDWNDPRNPDKYTLTCDERIKPGWWDDNTIKIRRSFIASIFRHNVTARAFKVGGYLDLQGTQIKSLPAGLKVGGYLDKDF